jgi:hypothetical protein
MEIIILCDQTDCTFNKTEEKSIFEIANAKSVRYTASRDFDLTSLMISVNICTHVQPVLPEIMDFNTNPPTVRRICHSKDKRV